MFEDRTIQILAYHLYTILAEKLETILSRNIANTRAKDFYDIYILSKLYMEEIETEKLNIALKVVLRQLKTNSVKRKVYAEVIIKALFYEKNTYTIDTNWGMCLSTYTLESQRNLAFFAFLNKKIFCKTLDNIEYRYYNQSNISILDIKKEVKV